MAEPPIARPCLTRPARLNALVRGRYTLPFELIEARRRLYATRRTLARWGRCLLRLSLGVASPRIAISGRLHERPKESFMGEALRRGRHPAGWDAAHLGFQVEVLEPRALLAASVVKDIGPGIRTAQPFYLTDVGDTVFFVAEDGRTGRELYKTDGTADGTAMVKEIRPGSLQPNISEPLAALDDAVL